MKRFLTITGIIIFLTLISITFVNNGKSQPIVDSVQLSQDGEIVQNEGGGRSIG